MAFPARRRGSDARAFSWADQVPARRNHFPDDEGAQSSEYCCLISRDERVRRLLSNDLVAPSHPRIDSSRSAWEGGRLLPLSDPEARFRLLWHGHLGRDPSRAGTPVPQSWPPASGRKAKRQRAAALQSCAIALAPPRAGSAPARASERGQLCDSPFGPCPPMSLLIPSANAILRPASGSLSPPAPIGAAGSLLVGVSVGPLSRRCDHLASKRNSS